MTPEQHMTFAKDVSLLGMCSEKGLLDPKLAAQGMAFYRERYNHYTVDDNLINQYMNSYAQYAPQITPQICQRYAVSLSSDILYTQKRQAEMAQAVKTFSDTANNISKHQIALANQMMQNSQILSTIPQPFIAPSIYPNQTISTCTSLGSGMASCTTRQR